MKRRMRQAAQILWPAFLIAGMLEMVVFSWIDPAQLTWRGGQVDAKTVYSLAFFVFWAAIALSALISHWMMTPSGGSLDEGSPYESREPRKPGEQRDDRRRTLRQRHPARHQA